MLKQNFQRVATKQEQKHFQSSYKTLLTLSGSYSKKIEHTFLKLTSNTNDILRELLVKITTQYSIVYIRQYWYFECSKLNHGKNFFPEFISQNTNTLRKLLSHNIKLFRVRISNFDRVITKVNTFLRVSMNTFQRIQTEYTQTENSLVKLEKLTYTHEIDNFTFNYSWD